MKYLLLVPGLLVLLGLSGCPVEPENELSEGREPGDCTDGADNDGDGDYDCVDEGCAGSPDCSGDDDDAVDDDDATADDDDAAANEPPNNPDVSIVPGHPEDIDQLQCNISIASEDPDGDTVYYRWLWTRNGEPFASDLPVIEDYDTTQGEEWSCQVYAFDGTEEVASNVYTVTVIGDNQPPASPVIDVTPDFPNANQPLNCSIVTASTDPEGDPITYEFRWLADSVETSNVSSEVAASETSAGQLWECFVTPWDGYGNGIPGTDSVVIE